MAPYCVGSLCRAWALACLCLLASTPVLASRQDCYGASIEVQLVAGGRHGPALYTAYGYPSSLGRHFYLSDPALGPLMLIVAPGDGTACEQLDLSPDLGHTALVARRGGCDFMTKAERAAGAAHAALILLDDEPGCVFMSSNDTKRAAALDLHALTLSSLAGDRLLAAASNTASITQKPPDLFIGVITPQGLDFAAPLLFLLAVGCVATGAALAAHSQRGLRTKQPPATFGAVTAAAGAEGVVVDRRGAWLFAVVASAALLALFFLSGWVLELLMAGVFALGAWQPLAVFLEEGLQAELAGGRCIAGTTGSRWIPHIAQLAAAGVCVIWLVGRDSTTWAWVPQDVMGCALLVFLLGGCVLPDLATACVLLPLAFAYDVWWVFLQPLVTHGPSVMVEVAAGGNQGPRLPMVLLAPLPGLGDNPAMAVLGLGDVALPGLLVAMLARWDVSRGSHRHVLRGYAAPAVLAYAVGLGLTYIALRWSWFGGGGQPALLYLVPCTLGTTLALAAARGELAKLWDADLLEEPANGGETSDPDDPDAGAGAETTGMISRV